MTSVQGWKMSQWLQNGKIDEIEFTMKKEKNSLKSSSRTPDDSKKKTSIRMWSRMSPILPE